MKYRILVVLEKGKNNYSAYAPEVPGCVSTGKTVQEALKNMQEALQLHLEGMAEDGDGLPLSASPEDEAHFLEVDVKVPAQTLNQAS